MSKYFYPLNALDVTNIQFALGTDRSGKPMVSMRIEPNGAEVAMVTCAAVTQWPRCTGDGNFGTMWGPTDPTKAKYTLDLTDAPINEQPNADYAIFKEKMESIDDALLDFVTENQLKILGRKNLSRDEVKMLQIRSIRPKYDKMTGALNGHTINLSTSKHAWDGMGGKYARKITICDFAGQTVPHFYVACEMPPHGGGSAKAVIRNIRFVSAEHGNPVRFTVLPDVKPKRKPRL